MNFYYLVKFQYLGYRYHGWQKQPNLKTLHRMIDKTINYVFGKNTKFKTLVASRTDAMVSANESAFELFTEKQINDIDEFVKETNHNLPQDIRLISVSEVDKDFNIIQHPKVKEYHYLFCQKEKFHPFCASIMANFVEELDIELMKQGAKLFEGLHNFRSFCSNVTEHGKYKRRILSCTLVENDLYTANFFPEKSYILKVKGKGFGYNQIRLMMGALVQLGKGEITLDFINECLKDDSSEQIRYIAPASGLILHAMTFT